MREVLSVRWRQLLALPGLTQDAILYSLAAVFAAVVGYLTTKHLDYETWGKIACIAYGAGAAICIAAALYHHHRRPLAPRSASRIRRFVFVGLLIGAALAPLGAEIAWRIEAAPGAHAQPEVVVIERAGDRAVHGQDPYLRHPQAVGKAVSSTAPSLDANTYFPYMPGMVSFGVLNALPVPKFLRDARFAFVVFTIAVALLALFASGARPAQYGRVLQFLIVLPTGALPMVTGGDDLPVVAMCLLGVVLAQRRNPIGAGLALGFAASFKFTAWPLVFLLAFAARDRDDRPAWGRYSLAVSVIVAPIVAFGLALQPAAFITNVVRFPLGLTHIKSPAASPLLGHLFINALPHHKGVVTAALMVLGASIAIAWLVRYPPRTPAAALRATAFVMIVATVLAPATRFGYLLYPANFLVFAHLLSGMGAREADWVRVRLRAVREGGARLLQPRQSPSPLSSTLTSSAVPPAGAVEDVTGSTKRPTSQ